MCSYNGKEVLRSSVTCEKKNGCREIETNGECCPKIICGKIRHLFKLKCKLLLHLSSNFVECDLNGTIYDNGDKIVDPQNPCEVCVCRGK